MADEIEKQVSDRQPAGEGPGDPAAESLASALRVSFRLLTLILVIMFGFYLCTGIRSVDSGEVGIMKFFGREVGVVGPGLAYTWPFPIGDIEEVSTRPTTITINDFYMHLTPEDREKDLEDIRPQAAGLRPGLDGALLTGDRSLLHMQLKCRYHVVKPIPYKRNLLDPEESVRSVVCAEAIRAAGARTADGLQRTEQDAFKMDVKTGVQRRLNTLGAGIEVEEIIIERATWPLAALPAYNAAQKATSERKRLMEAARADAETILRKAAGGNYQMLVGKPWQVYESASLAEKHDGPYDLIGQYNVARLGEDAAKSAKLQKRIDEVLLSRKISGEASQAIADARRAYNTIVQDSKARANRFTQLLNEYNENPEFLLQRQWAEVYEEILSSPLVEKVILSSGPEKKVIRFRRDPEIERAIRREMLKKSQEQKNSGKTRRPTPPRRPKKI